MLDFFFPVCSIESLNKEVTCFFLSSCSSFALSFILSNSLFFTRMLVVLSGVFFPRIFAMAIAHPALPLASCPSSSSAPSSSPASSPSLLISQSLAFSPPSSDILSECSSLLSPAESLCS